MKNVSGSNSTPYKDRQKMQGMPYAGNPKLYPTGAARVEIGKGYYSTIPLIHDQDTLKGF